MDDSTGEVTGDKCKRSDAPQLPEDVLRAITLRKRKQEERDPIALDQEPKLPLNHSKSRKRKTKTRIEPKESKKRVVHVKVLTSKNRIQPLDSVKAFKEQTRRSNRRTHSMLFKTTH